MNHPVIPIAVSGATRQRKREAPKGRIVEPRALAEVKELLGAEIPRRDRLIEYLHRINDRHGQLASPHLAALARVLGLAQTEVYEVATFYAHFDVVKEGETPPPAIEHDSESHTRTVTAGGGVSPSFTTSKCA